MNMREARSKFSCAASEWYRQKGWKWCVLQEQEAGSIELGARKHWVGSAIYGLAIWIYIYDIIVWYIHIPYCPRISVKDQQQWGS